MKIFRFLLFTVGCLVPLAVAAAAPGGGSQAAPKPPPGADSRTPISDLPYEITAPGSYYLTGNLVGTAGITITADYVTLDLSGFVLRGTPGSSSGIVVARGERTAPRHDIRVHNGAISDWGNAAVDMAGADGAQIADVRATRNGAGLRLGSDSSVKGVTVKDNGGTGIEGGDCTTVIGATVCGNAGDGINVGKGSVVASSSACRNTRGIVASKGSAITGVTAWENRTDGIVADNTVVKDATANGNLNSGIVVGGGSNVSGCAANQNGAAGIASSDFGRIAESTAYDNKGPGIEVGIGNTVVGNQLSHNAQGVHVYAARNRVESNHFTDNSQCGFCDTSTGKSALTKNTARFNGGSTDNDYVFQVENHGGIKDNFIVTYCPPDEDGEPQACQFSDAPPWANFSLAP